MRGLPRSAAYRLDVQAVAGFAALALVGLWIAYLVPHKLRYRQQMLESRTEDRYSGALRVLAVTDRTPRSRPTAQDRVECGPASEKRIGLLTPGRGLPVGQRTAVAEGGRAMDRPHGTQDRITADAARRTAQRRAAHAAAVARRGAAARRRGLLTAGLLVLTAAGWLVVGFTPVTVVAGVAPSVVLTTVLVLGRRAVLAGQRADAEFRQQLREAELAPAYATVDSPAVVGHAVRPSEASTEVMARITDDLATSPVERVAPPERRSVRTPATGVAEVEEAAEDEAWSPVPVPRPTYTMKATAPRREPVPLSTEAAEEGVSAAIGEAADDAEDSVQTASDAVPGAADAPAARVEPTTTGGLDLDAILARRRASGE